MTISADPHRRLDKFANGFSNCCNATVRSRNNSDLTALVSPLRWPSGCRDVREGVRWKVYNIYSE